MSSIKPASTRSFGYLALLLPVLAGCSSMPGMKSCRDGVCTTKRLPPPQGPLVSPIGRERSR